MRIVILTSYFPPEYGAASDLYYDLAETFIDDGHTVSVVTGFPRYRLGAKRQRGLFRRDRVGRSEVVRIASSPFDRGGPISRGLDHLYQAPSMFLGGLQAGKTDVILFHSPPLTLGLAAWALGKVWRVPFVANIQDLFPQYAVEAGVMTNRHMIRAFEALERFIYRTADGLTVNAPGNRAHLVAHGAAPHRVHAISNWIDVDVVRPGPRMNGFRHRFDLGDRFVVLYAGTMGYQQDLETVIEAAGLLRDDDTIRFVLIGDGVAKPELEEKVRSLGLRNVTLLPFQPREDFPQVLQAADACLVTLKKEVQAATIPSKTLGIMAAGRPVVMTAFPGGDAPRTVREAGCGVCVTPGRPQELADAILALQRDPEAAREMGKRGRAHAEREFSRQASAAKYEALFAEVIGRVP